MHPALALLLLAQAALPSPRDWPQSRADAQNSAAIELAVKEPARAWTFSGSGRVFGYEPGMTVWSSPALGEVEGRALLAVGSYDHAVYALDAASGEVLWKFHTGGPVFSAPTLSQGRVFAASSDRLVYALEAATGRQMWVHAVEDFRPTLGGARLSSPTLGQVQGQEALFVGRWVWDRSLGQPLQQGGVTALSAKDGKPLWKTELGDNQVASPLFVQVEAQGRVFAASSNGNLYALQADTGKVLWKHTELDAIRSPPAFFTTPEGPRVVLGSKFGALRCLDARTGQVAWSYKTGDRVIGSPSVAMVEGRPVVLAGSYDRTLYALEGRTGKVLWRNSVRGGIYSSLAVTFPPGEPLVLFSAWDHSLHAASASTGDPRFALFTGRPLWDVSGLDESNWSSPVVARLGENWMAFAGSYDGTFRALPLQVAAAGAPPRSDGWFWLSFPLALIPVAALARHLTVRDRVRNKG